MRDEVAALPAMAGRCNSNALAVARGACGRDVQGSASRGGNEMWVGCRCCVVSGTAAIRRLQGQHERGLMTACINCKGRSGAWQRPRASCRCRAGACLIPAGTWEAPPRRPQPGQDPPAGRARPPASRRPGRQLLQGFPRSCCLGSRQPRRHAAGAAARWAGCAWGCRRAWRRRCCSSCPRAGRAPRGGRRAARKRP